LDYPSRGRLEKPFLQWGRSMRSPGVGDAFTSTVRMVFSVAIILGTFFLVVVVALYCLQNFPNICVQIYGFRFEVYRLDLGIRVKV